MRPYAQITPMSARRRKTASAKAGETSNLEELLESFGKPAKNRSERKPLAVPSLLPPKEDPSWNIVTEGVDPFREREFESWFTVSNGIVGTRGSVEEGNDASDPATFIGGTYVELAGSTNKRDLVSGPNWTELTPLVGDEPVTLRTGTILLHQRVLDLRNGILIRTWRQNLPSGTLMTYRSGRFASMADPQLLVLWAEIKAGYIPAELGESYEVKELSEIMTSSGAIEFGSLTRNASGRTVRLAAVKRPGAENEQSAEEVLNQADQNGIAKLLSRHKAAWKQRWQEAEVIVEGDSEAQRSLRFALYHLISAGEDSGYASIGARGLTGRGYHGHVFWDTEVFVLPFFIATHPQTAKGLLQYRHRLLPAARAKAALFGYRGALYPWESADTGEEVTPPGMTTSSGKTIQFLTGLQEHHIAADVSWAAWRYWQWTGDEEFLTTAGAEILVETARFWASRARRRRDGRLHIAKVIGPDEYHDSVDDNAFTNVLARWNLERASEAVEFISGLDDKDSRNCLANMGVKQAELKRWRRVASGLVDGFQSSTGLYEQFAGYFRLKDMVAANLAERPFPADLLLGSNRIRRSQVIKQADVLMLAHMLPELMPPDIIKANYRYYEPRSSHGSSLSPAIHASIAARVGALDEALTYFRMAAAIDLNDEMGNAAQGIHMAAMGGLWQAVVSGFGGIRADKDALWVDPHLPEPWQRLAFPISFRGHSIYVDATRDSLTLTLSAPTRIAVGTGLPATLAGGRHTAKLSGDGWSELKQVVEA